MSVRDRKHGWVWFVGLWVGMIVLCQDPAFADDPRLLLGVLPADLAYQAGYTVLATIVMWGLVRVAWPVELQSLERAEAEAGDAAADPRE